MQYSSDHTRDLSEKELRIANYIREGYTMEMIAISLNEPVLKIWEYRHNILQKLQVKDDSAMKKSPRKKK
jgi:DNA-binding NarL/FixJ family response regulator